MSKKLALAVLGLALLSLAPQQAHATSYGSYLCAPQPPDSALARRILAYTSTSPNSYVLNGQGCTFVANADIPFFTSIGFSGGQNFFTQSIVALTANSTSANSPLLPAGSYIHNIVIGNTTANAVTGGVDIGTAANGAQIASAVAVGANALVTITDAALLLRAFGTGATPVAQTVYFTCHTACNGASLNLTIMYSLF
jgi:hypothetical protein